MNDKPFQGLFTFTYRHLIFLTIALSIVQTAVWITDLVIFADRGKSPLVPPLEAAGPWLLLPVLRRVFRGESVRKVLASPYMALVGGYSLVLSALLCAFILAFQVLNWIYHGEMNGGIFYFASLSLVFVWAARPQNPLLAND